MEYPYMIPPIDKSYYKMSHKEMRLYNEWYIETLGQRIANLEEYVQNCEGFGEWKAHGGLPPPHAVDIEHGFYNGEIRVQTKGLMPRPARPEEMP